MRSLNRSVFWTASWIAWDAAAAGAFPVWDLVVLVLVLGTAWHFLLNDFHELVRYTVFSTRWLGTAFLYIYSFLGWHDPAFFRLSHTRHHLYTLHPPRGREVLLPIRMRFGHFIRVAIVDPIGLYHRLRDPVIKAMGRTTGLWQDDLIEESSLVARQRLVWYNRLFLTGHLLVIGIAVATGTPSSSSHHSGQLVRKLARISVQRDAAHRTHGQCR